MKLVNSIKYFIFENSAVISILLIAAFYRVFKIADYMTFLGDEGRDVLVVYNILHGDLTLLGPTSSVGGFFLGPIYYYFMAPFLFIFNYDPVGPAVMVALLGIATVWFTYKVTKEFFGKTAGLIASLLYAISPLVVVYSRSSWNPNPMPFFTLLCLYVLYKGVANKKLIYFFTAGVIYGILMQLHYIEFFVGAIIFSYVLIAEILNRNNIKETTLTLSKKFVLIFVGFIVGISPYLAFEIRHGFLNTQNIIKFIFNSPEVSSGGNFFQITGEVFFRLFSRLITNFPSADQLVNFDKNLILLWKLGGISIALASFGFISYLLYRSYKKGEKVFPAHLFIFLWLVVGILLFGFYKKPIYDYYLEFMFPLPFIIIGSLFANLLSIKQGLIKIFTIFIFLILVVANLSGFPFKNPANRQLNQMRSIADFVMTQTNAKPFNFALITGGNSDHAYRYFFTVWNHPPTTIEFPGIDPERKTVTDQLFVVCESLPCQPIGHSLWEIAGFGRAEVAGKWRVSVVEIYKLIHYEEKHK